MSKLKVTYSDEEFRSSLAHKMEPIHDMSGAMYRCSVYLDRWVQTNFRTQGGGVGGWAPFKLGGRPTSGGGLDTAAKLLQDTGRLKASFIPFHGKFNAGIKSDLDYASTHEKGKGVPQRRMLPKRSEVNQDLLKIFKSEVFKNV